MNKFILISLLLLSFSFLFACTGTETIPGIPFTANQWISKLTTTDLNSFNSGDKNGLVLWVDWNRIGFVDSNLVGGTVYADIDGGFANSVYLPSQHFDGGNANN